MPHPPASALTVRAGERPLLVATSRGAAPSLALRARVVLLAADGVSHAEIARRLECSRPTVLTWTSRYAGAGLDGLGDRPRSGRPRVVTDHEVLDATLRRPVSAEHWTTRTLAAHLGTSRSGVSRVWTAYGVRPAPGGRFRFATDPGLLARGGRLVAVHLDAEHRVAVVAVDGPGADRMVGRGVVAPRETATGTLALTTLFPPAASDLSAVLQRASAGAPTSSTGSGGVVELLEAAHRLRGGLLSDAALHVVAAGRSTLAHREVAPWLRAHRDVTAHAALDPDGWPELVAAWTHLAALRPGAVPVGTTGPRVEVLLRESADGTTDGGFSWTSAVRESLRPVRRPSSSPSRSTSS